MPRRSRGRLADAEGAAPIAQIAAMVIGAVFLLLGVAGFIPGITSDFDKLSWACQHRGAQLLGVFSVTVLHNLVHAAFGVAGVVLARSGFAAQAYLFWGGLGYCALWLYGLAIDHHGPLNFAPVDSADNWLHLGLAVLMTASGLLLGRLGDPA
jgi:hypothetical protein